MPRRPAGRLSVSAMRPRRSLAGRVLAGGAGVCVVLAFALIRTPLALAGEPVDRPSGEPVAPAEVPDDTDAADYETTVRAPAPRAPDSGRIH